MATNNIKIFDQNKANMLSDEAYDSNTQRINGVQQGIASSQLQNKTLYQVSLVAYAIGQMMQANGLDANDADAVSTFANNMSQTIMQKVLDKANSDEAIAGTNDTKFITPATLKDAFGSLSSDNLTNYHYFGNENITILEAANRCGNGGTFFAANGNYLINALDRPSDGEMQYVVFVDDNNYGRRTVLAFRYTDNTYAYRRTIRNNSWSDNWSFLADVAESTLGIYANADVSQRRFVMSPQIPISYCPWASGVDKTQSVAYLLPNQEANLVLRSLNSSSSSTTIAIFNISTGIEYAAEKELPSSYSKYLLAYDNTSSVFLYGKSLNSYRFSSSSAPVLASTQTVSAYSGTEARNCSQNAFDNSNYLFGTYGFTNSPSASTVIMGCFYLNKNDNTLNLTSGNTNTTSSSSFPVGLVRLNETLAAVLNRNSSKTYGNGSVVSFINEVGEVTAFYTISGSSGGLDNDTVVCALQEQIIIGGGYTPIAVNIAGKSTIVKMTGTGFNLPDKTCLLNGAHYSTLNEPDEYPGVNSEMGSSLDASWNLSGGAMQCWMYLSYNARFVVDDSNIVARASAVPYSMFFI